MISKETIKPDVVLIFEFPIIFQMRTKYFGAEKPLIFEDLKATKEYKVHSTTELKWGDLDQSIKVEGDHTTTAEGVNNLHNTWYYNTCIKEHTMEEWRQSANIPTTDACLYTVLDLMTLRHYTW